MAIYESAFLSRYEKNMYYYYSHVSSQERRHLGPAASLVIVFVAALYLIFAGLLLLHHHGSSQTSVLQREWQRARRVAARESPAIGHVRVTTKDDAREYVANTKHVDQKNSVGLVLRRPILAFALSPQDAEMLANLAPLLDDIGQHVLLSQLMATARKPVRLAPDADDIGTGTDRDEDGNTCITECKCSKGGIAGYGRYCGMRFTGCPGTLPCNAIDRCCMIHDACVGEFGYTDKNCTVALAKCAACVYFSGEISMSSQAYETGWSSSCSTSQTDIAELILADILYLLPDAFDRAEENALAMAVKLDCDNNNKREGFR